MRNAEVARVLQDIADLLEIKGENRFKIRAYQRAVLSLEHLTEEVARLVAENRLRKISGVGEAIAAKITELVNTGHLRCYEELKAEFPEGISTLLEIPGIGPKTALLLASELGIKTATDLEAAIDDGRVAALPRLGKKTAQNIRHHLETLRRKDRRIPLGEALTIVEEVVSRLTDFPGLKNLTPAGSLRRFQETVGDIDLMGTADDPEAVTRAFAGLPLVSEVLARGPTKASVIVAGGLQVDLRIVAHDEFGSLLQHFTGSKQHNIDLRERAVHLGLSLSEYGITEIKAGKLEKFATEEAFYARQGLSYIPPEIREGRDEIELAAAHKLPILLVREDIRGDFHVHSDWSDGRESLADMARAAQACGYEYIGFSDHSAGRGIAHGLSVERVRQQLAEIKRLNETISGIRILSGLEVDIRADGSLDMPDELLAELDIVTAAVHSSLNQDEAKITARIIKALESPHVDVLAHPTGRLIQQREPAAVDMEAVLEAARRTGTAIEINAMPDRLDLKDTHVYRARELGVRLVIGTDSHHRDHLDNLRFGIGVARRGWAQAADILNTRPLAEVMEFLGH